MMKTKLTTTAVLMLAMLCAVVAARDSAGAPAPLNPGTGLSPVELAIWNDPVFQRQFAESYKAETEIEPTITVDERDKLQKVLELISADDLPKAADLLRKEMARNPAVSAVFDFTLANIHFQRDELEEAAGIYASAVEKFPKFRRAWKNLGLIHVRRSEFAEALPALTRVVELGGNDALTYGLLGFAYSSTDQYISAESAYRMAILLDPVTLDWKMGLARTFFKQSRHAEAAALCSQLVRQFPGNTDLWLLQANAHIGQNQPMEAAEIYEIVDRLGKSTVDSLNMLGDIYINEELYGLAVDAYIRSMKLEGDAGPDRAIRAAKILAARSAMEETRRLIEQLEQLKGAQLETGQRKELLKIRARLAVAEGANEEEVAVLREIVELDPLDGEALILLGQHSRRTGEVDRAVFYYEQAANIEGFEADAKVRHAQLLVGESKYAEALPLLRRAQQVNYRENIQDYLEQIERVAKTR